MSDSFPILVQSIVSLSTSSSVMQEGSLPQFLDQLRNITSNQFVCNMGKAHHLQHRCCPLLVCNFNWFNVKTALVHHPVIKKEVDELLAKVSFNHLLKVLAFTVISTYLVQVHWRYSPIPHLFHILNWPHDPHGSSHLASLPS